MMLTRKSMALAAFFAFTPILVGCEGGSEADNAPATQPAALAPSSAADGGPISSGWHEVTSSDGTYVVTYDLEPDEIPLNEPFGLRVRVCDADDRSTPLDNVSLAVDGRMPHHRHGMNRVPSIERTSDGTFEITNMLFHMPGYWELHFDITRGMTTERAQVEITLE
jgi:hypothetical protein